MRIHCQEAGAPLGRGMLLEQQCAMALNMALASAVIHPDHAAIVIIGFVRTDRISLTIMEGRYHQRSWFEANGAAGRLLTRRELRTVITRLQLEVLSPTSLSELQLDKVGTSSPRSCMEKTITDASEISGLLGLLQHMRSIAYTTGMRRDAPSEGTSDSGSDDLPLLVPASDPSDSEDCLNGPPGYSTEELVARDAPEEAPTVLGFLNPYRNDSQI